MTPCGVRFVSDRDNAATVWLRPCTAAERPGWGRDDVPWWWRSDDDRLGFRVPEPEETPHKCSTKGCPNEAWLVRDQLVGGWGRSTRHTRRRWCCRDHVYGPTLVVDGKVYRAQPRFPDDFDTGAELARTLGVQP